MTPQLPNLELIESVHSFPGSYTFKVIGDTRTDFAADALTLTLDALGEDRQIEHSSRISSAGNHTALTISVHVENAQEVHAIYSKLLNIFGLRALF